MFLKLEFRLVSRHHNFSQFMLVIAGKFIEQSRKFTLESLLLKNQGKIYIILDSKIEINHKLTFFLSLSVSERLIRVI